jgi:hypothetical protein
MHLDNLCNENQLDALFILNLFRPTCLGRIYCPSSGGIHLNLLAPEFGI